MKHLTMVKNIVTWLFFALVFALGVLTFLSGKSDLAGWRLLIVKSGSMEPTIKTGTLILVKKETSFQVGDIVTFGPVTRPEMLVTHRIIEIFDKSGHQYIKTKGDFNATEDQDATPIASVVAKYHFGIPYLGYLISFAQTELGVVLLIIVPGTIIIYDELMNLKRSISKLYEKFLKKDTQDKEIASP